MSLSLRVAPAWLRPTRRAIDWTALFVIAAAQLLLATSLGWREGAVPGLIQHLAVGGLAAAAVLGLGDPARALLQAVPTPAIVRLSRRVVLLVGATAVTIVVLVAILNLQLGPTPVQPGLLAPLVALIAFGIAVHVAASPVMDHPTELAASAVLLWVGSAAAIPAALVPDELLFGWLERPWSVTAAAVGVTLAMTRHAA